MTRLRNTLAVGSIFLGISVCPVPAQLAMPQSIISSGGGRSTGGDYTLRGSIIQPTGTLTGGDYRLEANFWGVIRVIQTANAPRLQITLRPDLGKVVLRWAAAPAGWVLEQSPTLGSTANWTEVSTSLYQTDGNDLIYIVSPPAVGNTLFFRLRKQ